MNFIRTTIFILLAAFTFIGNVGFNVFTHTCKKDGVFRSYFIQQKDHCDEHQAETLPVCCKKKAIKDDDCCNDEVDVVKFNLDFYNQYQQSIHALFIKLESFDFGAEKNVVYASSFLITEYIHPPPKPWGKDLLILHQVFRI